MAVIRFVPSNSSSNSNAYRPYAAVVQLRIRYGGGGKIGWECPLAKVENRRWLQTTEWCYVRARSGDSKNTMMIFFDSSTFCSCGWRMRRNSKRYTALRTERNLKNAVINSGFIKGLITKRIRNFK